MLTYPDYKADAEKLQLYVDASSTGSGGCLLQWQKGENRVIGFGSMCFSKTQRGYSTIERELAAIRWGCEHFKPFISGIEFELFTDHKPLIYMKNMSVHSSRVQRTMEELSEFNFKIRYIPGKLNDAADILSRIRAGQIEDNGSDEGLPKELKVNDKVDGGGDSMFQALLIAMGYVMDDDDIPESHLHMRKEVITELMGNIKKYKLINNKQERNKLKLMLNEGQLPCNEALLAASNLYNIEVRVFHDMKIPVVYIDDLKQSKTVMNLQFIGGFHFNPIQARREVKLINNDRMINTIET